MPENDAAMVYLERRINLERRFSLHSNRITVEARWLGGRAGNMTIDLSLLEPRYSTLLARSPLLRPAITLAVVAGGFAALIHLGDLLDALPAFALWVSVTLAVAGLLATLLLMRLITTVRFHIRERPEVVALAVSRVGPDQQRFDSFIAAIVKAIESTRTSVPINSSNG